MLESLTVAVPKNIVPRLHLPAEETAKFERVTGIKKTRHFEGSLAEFIKAAIDQTSIDVTTIEALLVVTQTPDRLSPCMAVEIAHHLGLPPNIPAIDMNHACDGFIMGLWAGQKLSGRTLVICADMLRYKVGSIEGLIFSDAVSIAVVTRVRYLSYRFYNDGSMHQKLRCGLKGEMEMDGNAVFDFVTTVIPTMVNNSIMQEISDWFVPHQANLSMNRILEMRAGFKGRTLYSIEEYGNQSMNSIPTNLAHNEDKILGKTVLLCGFGAGYTAAMTTIDWPRERMTKMVEV